MLRRMKRTVLLAFALAWSVLACDEDKKKAELLSKTGDSAAPTTMDAAAPLATTTASAAASAEPAKPKVCPDGPELKVDDPDMEAELRLKLNKPKDPLKVSDLSNVRSLNLTKKKTLDELDPCILPKLVNLKHLYLPPGKLRDLKPIAGLTQLESLRASITEVEDLKPLEKLVLLDRLDLGRTHIRDLKPLASLVNLTELELDDTQVSDLSPLAKCKKLEKLHIKHTNVTDVSPLKDLTKLKLLSVEGSAITNLDTLQPLVGRGLRVATK